MSMSDRDRKIMIAIVPILLLVGYWFLLLAPQRKEATAAGKELTQQEEKRDKSQARASQLEGAKATYSRDYATLVRLGKAIPTKVDMPSLIVQLESAAKGTGIRFDKIAAGERSDVSSTPPATPAPSGGGSQAGGNAQAGGAAAQSTPGKPVEQARDTAQASGQQAADASATDATTSTSKKGGLPVGGGAGGGSATPASTGGCAPGLECVPLDFEFRGDFFKLADFFHKLKRFVHVTNDKIAVQGRLMTIDGLKFSSGDDSFPRLTASVQATVYLSPEAQGATAGATPQAPGAAPADGGATPASTPDSTTPSTPTAAAVR